MREKLIELIEQAKYCSVEELADYLIAAGLVLPNQGHWVIHSSGAGSRATNWAECSECRVCGSPMWKVCPVCEVRMENHSAINIEEVDFDYAAEDM